MAPESLRGQMLGCQVDGYICLRGIGAVELSLKGAKAGNLDS